MKRRLSLLACVLLVVVMAVALTSCQWIYDFWNDPEHTHAYTSEVTKAVTCTEDGERTFTCECGEDTYTEPIKALGHALGAGTVSKAPTCTEKGEMTYICKIDSTHVITEEIEALGHDWDEGKVTQAPTCTEKGVKTFGCKAEGCKETKTEEVDALGHDYDDGVVTTNPTCTAKGVKTFTCTADGCNDSYTEEVDALDHDWDEGVVTNPTCTEAGYTTYTCKNDANHTKKEDGAAATDHSYDNGVVTTQPTCTATGVKTFTCTNGTCGHTKTETVAANGHTEETVPAVAPTCTATGLTEGTRCSVCKTPIVAQTVVDANGHTWDNGVVSVPASCTGNGTMLYTCTVANCGQTKTGNIAPKGHTEEDIPAVAPTCTATGLTKGVKCSVCGGTLVAQTVVNATGHTEIIDQRVEPTCTSTGLSEGKHCDVCKTTLVPQMELPMAAHTYDGPNDLVCNNCPFERTCSHEGTTRIEIPGKSATCTSTGLTKGYKCSACGEVTDAQQEIPATNHEGTTTTHPGYAATCTDKGLTDGVFCSACETWLTSQTEIPSLGHNYGAVDYVWADDYSTCTATRVCANDANHKEIENAQISVNTEAATCTTDGSTTYTATFATLGTDTKVVTIDHLGHNYGAVDYVWADDYSACTATRVCANDANHKEIENAQISVETEAATCTINGYSKYTATFTNTAFVTQTYTATLVAGGHTEGTAATCKSQAVCDVCGQPYGELGGHAFEKKDETLYALATSGDCNVLNTYYFICLHCDEKGTETFVSENGNYGTMHSESTTWSYSNGQHYHVCTREDCSVEGYKTDVADCSSENGGTAATCQALATCEVCNNTYGGYANHGYGDDNVCTVCGDRRATLDFADVANRNEQTSEKQVWAQNGITFTNDKAAATTNVASYYNPVRLYAGSNITIAFESINKIVFNCNTAAHATALAGTIGTENCTVDGKVVTVVFEESVDSYTVTGLTAQVQLYSIVVYADKTCEHTSDTAPTCVTPATCKTCGKTYYGDHNKETVTGYAATCGTDGLSDGLWCSVCETVFIAQSVIAATGEHNFDANGDCTNCDATNKTPRWEMVLDASALAVGDKIVIIAHKNNFGMGAQNGNYRDKVEITKSTIGNTNVVTWADTVVVVEIELVAGTKVGTFGLKVSDGYLAAISSSSNNLGTNTTLDDNASWSITIASDGTATIVAQGSNTRNVLQYNSGSPRFSCYGSASQTPVAIYKYSIPHDCDTNVPATCTDAAKCSVCGKPSTAEADKALGHTFGDWQTKTPATCEAAEVEYRTCFCGAEETQTGDAQLDHSYTGEGGVCVNGCGKAEDAPVETMPTTKYTFSTFTAGTQYAQGEKHTLDENTTLIINGAHLTTQIRLYSGSNAVFECAKTVSTIKIKAGNKVDKLNVYVSTDGLTWTLAQTVSVTATAYNEYTVELGGSYQYIKLESPNQQIRVSELTLNP